MKKKDWIPLALIFAALFVVFFDLFTLRLGFLSGDHWEQQYPWAKFYQAQIRDFSLPWWTTHLGCGFPLLAEGQIGAFYPLNFLFFFFLPAKVAYNYGILFHYFLGGLLFYFFLRRLKLSPEASFFSALIYLFGSTQGGYFYYNYISQKVVIWLPLTLLLVDRLRERESLKDAFFLGIVFAVQIFGGYLQVAVYSIFYTLCYLIYWWLVKRTGRFLWLCLLAGMLGLVLSMVQLLPTYELAKLSSRANAAKDIAYLGSMNPLGWLTLFYPAWDGFLKSELYVGLAGLFCVLLSFLHPAHPHKRFFVLAFFLFLLLALGRWSPLYVALVEGTGFASFRTPIKFLFFVAFSGAVLAAFGFDHLFKNLIRPGAQLVRVRNFFMAGAVFMFLIPVIVPPVLKRLGPQLVPWLQRFAQEHIFAKPGHPFSLKVYLQKAVNYYEGIIRTTSLTNSQTLVEWLLLILLLLFLVWLFRTARTVRFRKAAVLVFLFCDLFLYGFTSIRPGLQPLKLIDVPGRDLPIIRALRSEDQPFRVMEIVNESTAEQNRRFPSFPSTNMLYGIDNIGIYSPLAIKAYRDFISGWGYVNDSLASVPVSREAVREHLKALSFLNVKYLLSIGEFKDPRLEPVLADRGVFLYRNKGCVSRAFFMPHTNSMSEFDQIHRENILPVRVSRYAQQSLKIEYEAPSKGLLVVSDLYYPNWKVTVNGRDAILRRAGGLFRAVSLESGKQVIHFRYEPVTYQRWGIVSMLIVIAGFLLLALQRLRKPKDLLIRGH